MSTKTTFIIEEHQAGQPRAYADSVYDSTITATRNDNPFPIAEAYAKKLANALVREFTDKPDCWADTRLQSIRPVVPLDKWGGCPSWRVVIIQPYCD